MFVRSFPGMSALHYPFFSPNEEGGEATPPEFVEQPGDREPEGEAPAGDGVDPADLPPPQRAPAEPEPEPAPEREGEPVAAESEGDPEGEGDPEPEKPKKDWRDRQIIKARQAERDARAEAAAATQRAKELEAQIAGGAEGATVLTPAERDKIRAEAIQEVQQQSRFQRINDNSEAMFEAGTKAFPKTWESRVKDAAEIFSDEMRAKPEFLETITDLDNSAAVYHELAGDPDKMEAVLNMPPHKMGVELARISAKLSSAPAPRPVSRAPAPIRPLDGPSVQERSLEDLANDQSPAAMKEFDRRMALEEEKRWKARR